MSTIPTKVCSKCQEVKPVTEFHKHKLSKDGYRWKCKSCRYSYRNDPKIKDQLKRYRNNPKIKTRKKEKQKEYYNKSEVKAQRSAYMRNKRKTNHKFAINERMTASINHSLSNRGSSKGGKSWKDLVDYTMEELMVHLESNFQPGMTWENRSEWHIDHIRPKASFDYTSPDDPEFKECWALSNLQPLWAEENLRKGNKWDGE